jgi:histidinol-phosphate/aromatic aminotransferase/cobyric acid decarboxylase-like protein
MKHFFERRLAELPLRPRRPGSTLNLSSNELHHPDLSRIVGEILADMPAEAVTRYPSYDAATEAAASYLGVEADRVLLTAGSDDGARIVAHGLASPVGRAVLQVPNYEGWEHHLRSHAVELVRWEVSPSDLGTERAIELLGSDRPSLLVLSNPVGPLGVMMPTEALLDLARRVRDRHLLVLDECYVDFSGATHGALGAEVVRVRSFSKSFGIAGARVGAVTGPREIIAYLRRLRPENAVSGPALYLVERLLRRRSELERVARDIVAARGELAEAVIARRPTWRPLDSRANFACFVVPTEAEARTTADALLARGVRVKAFTTGGNAYVRVTAAPAAVIAPFFAALDEVPPWPRAG